METNSHRVSADAVEVRLIEPSIQYKDSFLDMIQEWEQTGEKMVPFVLRMDTSDFSSYIDLLRNMETESTEGKKTVNSSTYWLVNDEDKVLGAVNIRHALNEHLLKIGGHIGFGIRPSERRRGYATRLLALALEKAKELGLGKVLVTCDEDNEASRRTIVKSGGVLENETFFNGKMVQRYWIELD